MDDNQNQQRMEPVDAAIYSTQSSPAPPNTGGSRVTYRVRGIPSTYSTDTLPRLLELVLGIDNGNDLQIRSLALNPDRKSKTATVDFGVPPPCLLLDSRHEFDVEINAANEEGINDEDFIPRTRKLTIDTHFKGITTLRYPSDHKIDCIAISGLGGHAFGSFKERGKSHMWLRDSLPWDLPGARIMLFGYDTQVYGSHSFQDLEALATSLRSHLIATREASHHPAPLIFIAHSLGGILVKGAIIQLKRDREHQEILASIYGALFFGVPNQGMDIASLVAMAKDQPNQALIHSLGPESQILREQCRYFPEAFDSRDSKVVCFYETLKSPTAKLVGTRWQMAGPPSILVHSSSATHGRYWETEAHHNQALNRTHSDLVKFSYNDADYDRVIGVLKKMAAAATHSNRLGTLSAAGSQNSLGSSSSALTLSANPTGSSTMSGQESSSPFSEAMQKGQYYFALVDKTTLGENNSLAQTHFLNALEILNSTRAEPSEFIKVYNGLMHVHLHLTFQPHLGIESRKEHLQTAIEYNNESLGIARRSLVADTGALAQVKLQQAVLYGREVQLRAKQAGKTRTAIDLRDVRDIAIDGIERALRQLLESNHTSKEKSIVWGKEWQDRLKKI